MAKKDIMSDAASAAQKLVAEAAVKAASILEEAAGHAINMKVMANDLGYVRKDISDIKVKLESHYITKSEFAPVKAVVFGLVGIILIGVMGAIIALVIIKP